MIARATEKKFADEQDEQPLQPPSTLFSIMLRSA